MSCVVTVCAVRSTEDMIVFFSGMRVEAGRAEQSR